MTEQRDQEDRQHIPYQFDESNLYLIGPDRTFRDGDTVWTDVTVNRTETGRFTVWGFPRPAA